VTSAAPARTRLGRVNSRRRRATEGGLCRGAAPQHRTVAVVRGTGGTPLRGAHLSRS
jgi:hypothetical protein